MKPFRFVMGCAVAMALCLCLAAGASAAGLFPAPGSENSNDPLEIVADRLVTNDTEKFAEFSGSVKAIQGKFTITSDTLRIYYEGDLVNAPKGSKTSRDSIKRIVAGGKVHIVTDEYTADAQRAEYVLETDELTLSGPNSRVISGKNTLTGSKIILNRGQGRAQVESSANERVKAVFYQEGKNSDILKPKKEPEPNKEQAPKAE